MPRGTPSQPISTDSPPPSSRLSPRQALVEASQVSTFEALLREAQPEEAVIPPAESSEQATAASIAAADEPADVGFDEHMEDSFDGLNWDDFLEYIKPIAT